MPDERIEELMALKADYPELALALSDPYTATLDIPVGPRKLKFADSKSSKLAYLPPLKLKISLPKHYPEWYPPDVSLNSQFDWIPADIMRKFKDAAAALWREGLRRQMLLKYVDLLHEQTAQLRIITALPRSLQERLVEYNANMAQRQGQSPGSITQISQAVNQSLAAERATQTQLQASEPPESKPRFPDELGDAFEQL